MFYYNQNIIKTIIFNPFRESSDKNLLNRVILIVSIIIVLTDVPIIIFLLFV